MAMNEAQRSRTLARIIASLPPQQRIKVQAKIAVSPDPVKFEELLLASFGKNFNA